MTRTGLSSGIESAREDQAEEGGGTHPIPPGEAGNEVPEPADEDISYPVAGHGECFGIEDNSFWFKHRNRCIVTTVRRFPPSGGGRIVDVGGGNGYVAKGLADAGFDVVLVEPGRDGAANARRRGLTNVICASLDTAAFEPESIAAIGLFDVVEHLGDDVAFLRQARALLKPQGNLYLTVPAYSALWSAEDEFAGHFRRYSLTQLRSLLGAAGFDVQFATCIFRYLPLPIWLMRALPHRLGFSQPASAPRDAGAAHRAGGGVLRGLLDRMHEAEMANLASGRAMRFGGSCLAVATPRSNLKA